MTQPLDRDLPDPDSIGGLIVPRGRGEPIEDSVPGAFEPAPGRWRGEDLDETRARVPERAPIHPPGDSLRFLGGFSLPDRDDESAVGPESLAPVDGETILRQRRRSRSLRIGRNASGPVGRPAGRYVGPRSSRDLPGPGDVLAGFLILHELGRGAFARVYLAEEIHLGSRLVAIKVSRAEGDEPRILARLQHTNIVPVHSVCDDPLTGLRVLCMPYFGGANLAQILDKAGALTDGRSGHTLVDALDQISQHQPVAATEFLRPSTSRPRSTGPSSDLSVAAAVAGAEPRRMAAMSAVGGSSLAYGFRSLLGRIMGVGAMNAAPEPGPASDDDPHQPSRQFLREATAVQAAAWIVARLAEGLDHAHSRGLFHRDLKPANILLAGDGTPMLLDFNLAADCRPPAADGEIGRAFLGGTLPYMAPEHLDAFDPGGTTPAEAVAERADIYAMGLILFEMLAGQHPFPAPASPPGSSTGDLIAPMIEARRRPPSLRSRCPHVPWSLDALVAKCLSFDPAGRYARARDLAEDLRRFLEDLPMKYAPEPSLRERAAKFARRHKTFCSTTSIALISLAMILALTTGVAVAYSGMQGLMARFQRQAFERDFTEAQFLLNTADGENRHLDAGLVAARKLRDRLDFRGGQPDSSAAWFRCLTDAEQLKLRQEFVELTLLEARARVRLGRGTANRQVAMRRAIDRLDAAERVAEHVPAALYRERAEYHRELGEARLAERDRELAAAARPSSSRDWTMLATSLLTGGDPPAAEEALRKALRADNTDFWAWFIMGHCHYAQHRFLEASGDFSACTALGPQFAWAHFNRGLALARAGQLAPARDAYDQALRLAPDFTEAMVDRALVELELDQVDSALADLTLAIRLGRAEVGVLAARGEALARLGRTAEAHRQFDTLLSIDPGNAVIQVARAMTLLRSDPRVAREDFGRVLESDPRHAAAHYGMALLVRAQDPAGALKHLDVAVDSDPHLVDAIQLRALVRARMGDPAALDDVDRLLKTPTARRYYNAACAVALFAEKGRQPRQRTHAVELLARAVALGFPAREAANDPDLETLRDLPGFRRLLGR